MKDSGLTRRAFLAAVTTTAAVSAWSAPNTARVVPRKISPNEKVNVAGIGVGGKGSSDILSFLRENVVAVCDVDFAGAEETVYRLPKAKQYKDYRKMLDEMGKDIDALTIATPDHTHAPAAYMAMKLGKHVYVEKPLAHTVAEVRLLRKTAAEMGVATQMGNQGHSLDALRELTEMLRADAIGKVTEVHVWTDRPGGRWPKGGPAEAAPAQSVPATLDWDLWIGTAPERAYNELYAPRKWRGWMDFGCGGLGDMGCHIMDPAWFALNLHEAPSFSVEPVRQDGKNDQTWPAAAVVKYAFPARGDMPAVDLYWYEDGQKPPVPAGLPEGTKLGDNENGSLFIGEKGIATAGEYGGSPRLLPDDKMKDFTPPAATLPRVPGGNHYRSFLSAIKGGDPASSNFEYAAPFTEMVLMGNIALRCGARIEYDAAQAKITNLPEANALLTKAYRKGWELPV